MVNDIERLNVKEIMTREPEYTEEDILELREKGTLRKMIERQNNIKQKRKQFDNFYIIMTIVSFVLGILTFFSYGFVII